LLNRLYPSEPNQIFVNGHSIEKIEQRSLHSQLVLIPQEAFLFSDTIHDNIHFIENSVLTGQDLHEQVRDWARVVDIESEIESLPMKFESHLGERGVNLSGGQKQRLTIARGLVVRAPLIMMDDSLSAVDTKTEKSIQDRLNQSHGRRQSKLIVSHRLTSVESADKIIVLREGEIEAMGTHQELLKISPTYSGLALLQEENESGATHE
jgi:ATP-binding cassette, subfamily B, multidrug efflux pump